MTPTRTNHVELYRPTPARRIPTTRGLRYAFAAILLALCVSSICVAINDLSAGRQMRRLWLDQFTTGNDDAPYTLDLSGALNNLNQRVMALETAVGYILEAEHLPALTVHYLDGTSRTLGRTDATPSTMPPWPPQVLDPMSTNTVPR